MLFSSILQAASVSCVSYDCKLIITNPYKYYYALSFMPSIVSSSTWVPDGCETSLNNSGFVNCSCNHLTNYAVLTVSSHAQQLPLCTLCNLLKFFTIFWDRVHLHLSVTMKVTLYVGVGVAMNSGLILMMKPVMV